MLKRTLSLKTQLIFIILQVTLFSTTLSFSFSIIYDFINSLNDLKNSMQFTGRLMAENVKSSLLFKDELGANELLLSLKSIPTVLMATVGVGTGLGLSVSFFIITKNHGGTIDFESIAGVGTRLIIRLPNKHDT